MEDKARRMWFPTYLLKTRMGNELHKSLQQSTETPLAAKDRKKKLVARMSTLGLLGVEPQLFAKDEAYTDAISRVFEERSIPESQVVDECDRTPGEDGFIDAPTEPPIYLALTSSELDTKQRIPLPTAWTLPPNSSLDVSPDGTEVSSKKRLQSNPTIRIPSSGSGRYSSTKANHGVSTKYGVYYYEVHICAGPANTEVSVGFMRHTGDEMITNLPGHEAGTFGYNGRDGKIISNQNGVHSKYGAKFGNGDVIGCGVNFMARTIFYTKNGVFLGEAFSHIKNDSLIPVIGMSDYNSVRTNFGFTQAENFVFDIDNYVQSYKNKIFHDINMFTVPHAVLSDSSVVTKTLATVMKKQHTVSDDDLSTILNKFIESYFDHEGYYDSAEAFTKDLQLERDIFEKQPQPTKRDEDVRHRQTVRHLILSGEIDEAIRFIRDKYPGSLEKNDNVKFELQCLKLVNMIREGRNDDSLLSAIAFGKHLQKQYEHHEELVSFLHDISNLLVFEDPESSEQWHTLNTVQKQRVAEDVNVALLEELKKPTESIFERVIEQTRVALKDMPDQHKMESALINLDEDFLDV